MLLIKADYNELWLSFLSLFIWLILSVHSAPTRHWLISVPLGLLHALVQCSTWWRALCTGLHMDLGQSNWILETGLSKTLQTDILPLKIWKNSHISMLLLTHISFTGSHWVRYIYDCQTPEYCRQMTKKRTILAEKGIRRVSQGSSVRSLVRWIHEKMDAELKDGQSFEHFFIKITWLCIFCLWDSSYESDHSVQVWGTFFLSG